MMPIFRMAAERLDLVIFGATGFTGKNTIKEAQRLAKDYQFTWGIAGRRKDALDAALKEYAPESENIPVIIADLKNEESLKKMAEQARVLVNCCGPYRFYGEPVIKACIAAGTHHVDVSGEPQFMEKMQLDYNKAAREAGVYVISACGLDSIPADMGLIYTQNQFNGEINSVETYLKLWGTGRGPGINFGTWESAVYGYAHMHELRALRSKLYPEKLPEFKPKLKLKKTVHCTPLSEGYSVPFPGSDRAVCLRTQRYLYDNYKQRPAQVQTYMTFKTLFQFIATAIVGGIFATLAKTSFGRNLLLKHPKLFSLGLISHENPRQETIENTWFSVTLVAKGWSEKLADPLDQHKEPPNKEMITKVSGRNPGYGATCTALVLSAVTILKESDKMPDNGGVLPPGAAFCKTSLIDELNKNGVKFEVISSIDKVKESGNDSHLRLDSQNRVTSKM
ncbi:saccharopine dehydrogenase-like oxidoreductase isoform X3 [Trichogramma pretiosum]|uniref:saccharopine dehydrogenase-like oxidoreductase isoform X2 n=2 Tax=Trichogramma pretiosum TaxID=7493 RepID=UPI0006C9B7FC|nr:saccharopine dehydrogenase-like oxidoreductase isoform X2 [Trichogramma pretiosum]XP_023318522.1 saccharopine dehydrogenase-like oxidoreductase isoform X3 [Trichogramma pretiosum]